jgi:hypothetical protein
MESFKVPSSPLLLTKFAVTTAVVSSIFSLSCQAQGAPKLPSELEFEVWKAAMSINTRTAYEEYMAKFPGGYFIAMANAALQGLPGSQQNSPPSSVAQQVGAKLDALRDLDRESSAVDFRPGDRFYGPGIIRSGWFGAKKQIALPAGEWIVLTVVDHFVDSIARVQMTSVALGRFQSDRLDSLIAFTANSRPFPRNVATPGLPPISIPSIESCNSNGESAISERSSTPRQDHCLSVQRVMSPRLSDLLPPSLGVRIDALIDKSGATAKGPVTRSVIEVQSPADFYAHYVRLAFEDTKDLPTQVASFKRFRPAVMTGIFYKYDSDDLRPGVISRDGTLKFED